MLTRFPWLSVWFLLITTLFVTACGGTEPAPTTSSPSSSSPAPVPVPVPGQPTVSLSAMPTAVTSGGGTTLSWTSSNATSCTASGGWSGAITPVASGNRAVSNLTTTTTYTLACTGAGGTTTRSVTVNVSTTPAITVTLSALPTAVTSGNTTTLSWTSTNATSCTASGGWSGAISPVASGSRMTDGITSDTTYTLMCSGNGNSNSASVTVRISTPITGGGAPEAALLNYAETWAQNWNFDGHTVDSRFTSNYGFWEMNDATSEPWLFDRTSVAYYLYRDTGNTRWRDLFLTYFNFYRTHIDAQGIFTPKGFGDTKYSYVTPFLLYERETGDNQYRPIAKRIYDTWAAELPNNYSTGIGLWTEREIGFALEAAVSYYELTGEAAALTRARALLNHWDQVCGTNPVPLHTLEQHGEEFGNAWATRRMTSPWMSGLYFQAALRLHHLAGDTQPLNQIARYADWLDRYGLVDAGVVSAEYAGYTIPYYLVDETGSYTAESPSWGDAEHAYDVGNLLEGAIYAKTRLGQSTTAIQARRDQLHATAMYIFDTSVRTTSYLPKYRLNPPRKFNWWYRSRTLLD